MQTSQSLARTVPANKREAFLMGKAAALAHKPARCAVVGELEQAFLNGYRMHFRPWSAPRECTPSAPVVVGAATLTTEQVLEARRRVRDGQSWGHIAFDFDCIIEEVQAACWGDDGYKEIDPDSRIPKPQLVSLIPGPRPKLRNYNPGPKPAKPEFESPLIGGKFTPEQIEEMRTRYRTGESIQAIAQRAGIAHALCSKVLFGRGPFNAGYPCAKREPAGVRNRTPAGTAGTAGDIKLPREGTALRQLYEVLQENGSRTLEVLEVLFAGRNVPALLNDLRRGGYFKILVRGGLVSAEVLNQ